MTTKQVDTNLTVAALEELITTSQGLIEKIRAAADAEYAKFILAQSDAARDVVRKARAALEVLPKFPNNPRGPRKTNGNADNTEA